MLDGAPDPTEGAKDPRFTAALDLMGRMGAKQVHVRYQDDQQPVLWVVAVEVPSKDGWAWDCAGAMDPLLAATRLLEQLTDGGHCAHCDRTSALWTEWQHEPPFAGEAICWYIFDPETEKFRRSCEGETSGRVFGKDPKTGKTVGRNDLCPCGSGEKYKRCHGAAS